jgi:chromosome segregation ATPase
VIKRVFKVWIIVLAGALCVWGCTQSSGSNKSRTEKIKSLEDKLAKLDDENKSVTLARDQLRKKLIESEEQKLKLQHALEEQQTASARERDELKSQVAARTNERDNLQTQFESMRKALHNILTQADAVSASFSQRPVTSASGMQSGGY